MGDEEHGEEPRALGSRAALVAADALGEQAGRFLIALVRVVRASPLQCSVVIIAHDGIACIRWITLHSAEVAALGVRTPANTLQCTA